MGTRNRMGRLLWGLFYVFVFRPSPRWFFGWRRFLLRCFGASIGKAVHVYPNARIWAPWNLEMGDHSCLSFETDCYCVDRIRIGAHATVSQYAFLCAATMFLVYLAMLLGPIATLATSATTFQNNLAGMERVLDLLAEPSEAGRSGASSVVMPGQVQGAIEFQSVGFRYPGSEPWVLQDINLQVAAGETVALVGRSGAGKTDALQPCGPLL